jgi:hypothetical protein
MWAYEIVLCQALPYGAGASGPPTKLQVRAYGMCTPLMLRAITRRWISDVPSKIV